MQNKAQITEHIVDDEKVLVHHPYSGSEGFCISFGGGGWMPGCYDSVESALLGAAACFIDENLFVTEVQQPINHVDKQNRLITTDDIIKQEPHNERHP